MKKLLLILFATTLVVSSALAQTDPDGVRSTAIMDKIQKLDVVNLVLPLLLTKEQLKSLLPSIEKAREQVKIVQKKEADVLRKLEPTIDAALKEALEKNEVVKKEVMAEAVSELGKLAAGRQFIAASNTEAVLVAFKATANKGQIKTAVNSLDPRFFAPGTKIEEVSEDIRLRMFVAEILLHPAAYEVMRKLSM